MEERKGAGSGGDAVELSNPMIARESYAVNI
jgi:hypothetical protein